ncbi:hypothetical protein FIU66_06725 [Paracoccus sp. AK26]|nr:hypothetical protein FIU66_06725 [Paracoccus sp. AK26]
MRSKHLPRRIPRGRTRQACGTLWDKLACGPYRTVEFFACSTAAFPKQPFTAEIEHILPAEFAHGDRYGDHQMAFV